MISADIDQPRGGAALRHLPLGVSIALAAGLLIHGPIAQLENYHGFADARSWVNLPNAANVLSNLAFAAIGLWGLLRVWPRRGTGAMAQTWPGHLLFLSALILTALGSAFYHWAPDDHRLVWDRLPIALICAGLLSGTYAELRPASNGRLHATLLSVAAALSVAWWYVGTRDGAGDLRPYLFLQVLPMLLLPLWQWIYRAPRFDRWAVAAALAFYGLARLAELADHGIMTLTGAIMSGHTLKHLLAAAATGALAWRIVRRYQAATYPHQG